MWLQQFFLLALFTNMVINKDLNVMTKPTSAIKEVEMKPSRHVNATEYLAMGIADAEVLIKPSINITRTYNVFLQDTSKKKNPVDVSFTKDPVDDNVTEDFFKMGTPTNTTIAKSGERELRESENITQTSFEPSTSWMPENITYENKSSLISSVSFKQETSESKFQNLWPSQRISKLAIEWRFAYDNSSKGDVVALSATIDASREVSAMAWQILWHRIPGCHFVLATADSRQSFPQHIIRLNSMASQPVVVVDTSRLANDGKNLQKSLWGDTTTTCRTLLIDLTAGGDRDIFRFLDSSKLWLHSNAWIVIVGDRTKVEASLKDRALRNNLSPLYLSLEERLLSGLTPATSALLKRDNILINRNSEMMIIKHGNKTKPKEMSSLFGLCRYCDDGKAGVRLLFTWWPRGKVLPLILDPFPDQLENMRGHRIRAVGMPFFPFMDYVLDTKEPATTVTMLDCVDRRMLETFSAHLNFTYELRAPWDSQFGVTTDSGNWTGLVGTIQYEKADITTMIAPNPGRNMIFDHMRAYPQDPLAVISPKPQVLPQYYLILRPFSVDVWLYLLLSIVLWGLALWLLQKAQSYITEKHSMDVSAAIFYSWSVIMQCPPDHPPSSTSGQMLLGWWLVACIVITTAYNSSLVAHLTVQSKTKPIDTFDDLAKQPNWKWGLEKSLFGAAPLLYFKASTDPNMLHIYKYMESITIDDALKNVLRGRYSLLCQTSRMSMIIDSYHTDDFGRTPYYISKKGAAITADFGWGIRKGAPYRDLIQQLMNRLLEAGITDYWIKTVKTSRVKLNRKAAKQEQQVSQQGGLSPPPQIFVLDDGGQTVLNLNHMMGVFLLLLLGYIFAFIAFLGERLLYMCYGKFMHH